MRIGLDATPLLGRATGVGRYTRELVTGLAASEDDEVVLTAFSARGTGGLRSLAPPGARVTGRRVPARALRALWARGEHPRVSLLTGGVEVFHATNFVLPPTGRAAGVVTVHDLAYLRARDAVDRASLAYRELVPRSIRRAHRVVVPSRAVAAELIDQYGLDVDSVVPVHLGVDPVWSTAMPDPVTAARLNLPGQYVVVVGTVEPRKNVQTAVDALAALRGDPRAPHLVVVGPPGWGAGLDTSRLPAGRLHETGYLTDRELVSVVAGSRALLFPSRYEGFGLPPLEALACGRPALVSDLPVMREVLGDLAVYLPVDDVDAWADAIAQLSAYEDPADVRQRQQHAAGFTWTACSAATREVYVQAARSAGTSAVP